MKATIEHGTAPKQFVPFTLTMQVQTLAEANALYALHGWITGHVASLISSGILSREVPSKDVQNAWYCIGSTVYTELERQGVK